MIKNISLFVLLFFTFNITSQVPKPSKEQFSSTILIGGTIHTGTGKIIKEGFILFENGIIKKIGNLQDLPDTNNIEVFNVQGQDIYPGLILPNSIIGLSDIGAVRASRDDRETGTFNPNIRSLIAYNTDSEIIPTLRFNGILLAQCTPHGGFISGSSSIMMLDGWNWEDAVYQKDIGIHLRWPAKKYPPMGFTSSTEFMQNKNYKKHTTEIKDFFYQAIAYSKKEMHNTKNIRYEAMRNIFNNKKTLFVHANLHDEIIDALTFIISLGIKNIVLVGGTDAHYVSGYLKENEIPIILNTVHRLPLRPGEDIDLPYRQPGILHKKGLKVALSYDWLMNSRNLPFLAGTATAYGVSKEEALQFITKNPADILKIGKQTGTIEPGKDANIVVSKGDILDMKSNNITYAFIKGREIILNGKQQMLYERFKEKYTDNKTTE